MFRVLQSANWFNSSFFVRSAETITGMIASFSRPSNYVQMQPIAVKADASPVRRPRRRRHPRTSNAAVKTTWF